MQLNCIGLHPVRVLLAPYYIGREKLPITSCKIWVLQLYLVMRNCSLMGLCVLPPTVDYRGVLLKGGLRWLEF